METIEQLQQELATNKQLIANANNALAGFQAELLTLKELVRKAQEEAQQHIDIAHGVKHAHENLKIDHADAEKRAAYYADQTDKLTLAHVDKDQQIAQLNAEKQLSDQSHVDKDQKIKQLLDENHALQVKIQDLVNKGHV